jgi:hypothetical protein
MRVILEDNITIIKHLQAWRSIALDTLPDKKRQALKRLVVWDGYPECCGRDLCFFHQVPLPVAVVPGESRFERLLCSLRLGIDTEKVGLLR